MAMSVCVKMLWWAGDAWTQTDAFADENVGTLGKLLIIHKFSRPEIIEGCSQITRTHLLRSTHLIIKSKERICNVAHT